MDSPLTTKKHKKFDCMNTPKLRPKIDTLKKIIKKKEISQNFFKFKV